MPNNYAETVGLASFATKKRAAALRRRLGGLEFFFLGRYPSTQLGAVLGRASDSPGWRVPRWQGGYARQAPSRRITRGRVQPGEPCYMGVPSNEVVLAISHGKPVERSTYSVANGSLAIRCLGTC